MFRFIAVLSVMTLVFGCSTVSDKQGKYLAETAQAYYSAPNTATCFLIENTNKNAVAEWTVKNFTRMEISMPVPPKAIIPRDPGFFSGLFDTAKTIAPWAFFGWAIHDGGLTSSTSTTTAATAAQ